MDLAQGISKLASVTAGVLLGTAEARSCRQLAGDDPGREGEDGGPAMAGVCDPGGCLALF